MQIDALLFDKDGTLFEFAATWEAWALAFLTRASGGDRALASQAGAAIGFDLEARSFSPDSIAIAGTPIEIADALLASFPHMTGRSIVDLINEEASRAPQCEAVPLRPFLTGLKARGLKLGVATNDAEDPALAHLTAAGVRDLFDIVMGCDSGFGAKPAPGQQLAFADRTGIDPARIAMVGDSLHDLIAGRAAGMVSIGVLTGMASERDLRPHAAEVFPDIGHIPDWLNTLQQQKE
ncbi:MAG: HAD family hydrolase [Arenibacterium sp.]